MGSMLDYLDWRGDISLSYSLFNDVDSLILSCLSYVNFDGIVPAPGAATTCSLESRRWKFRLSRIRFW